MAYSYEPHYFEDFEIGTRYETAGRTITETDFVVHAAVSGNWSELSTNEDYASGEWVGERFARGPHLLVIASGLLYRCGVFVRTVRAITGIHETEFVRPVTIGETLALEFEVVDKGRSHEAPPSGELTLDLDLSNGEGATVMTTRMTFLVRYRKE